MKRDADWSEREIKLARKLWAEGCSADYISRALADDLESQRTRSAVCAKIMRNPGLFPPRAKRRAGPPPMARPEVGDIVWRRASQQLDPEPPRPVADGKAPCPHVHDDASRAVPLVKLGLSDCRFPVNHPAPGETHLFCGARTMGGPYCAYHSALAYVSSDADRHPIEAGGPV